MFLKIYEIEIKQVIYSSYRAREITKKVYTNTMNLINL